jgi:hypothetical protein
MEWGMDPFDEFEFKPITTGLGFQKKSSLKEQVKASGLAEEHLQAPPTSAPRDPATSPQKSMSFGDVISSLEKAPFKPAMGGKTFLEMTEPLPRSGDLPKRAMDVEVPRTPPPQSPFPSQDIFRQPPMPGNGERRYAPGRRRFAESAACRDFDEPPFRDARYDRRLCFVFDFLDGFIDGNEGRSFRHLARSQQ